MVFVLNFDEHGAIFRSRAAAFMPRTIRCRPASVLSGSQAPGFRVPAIAMGPFAPRKIEKAGPYEHCSILRMIEWRWGLEPMTLRDRTRAKNLADALDFKTGRDAVTLPPFVAPPNVAC